MAITTVNSYLTASGLNFRSGTTGAASILLDSSTHVIKLSGNFNVDAGSLTIGGNPIVTGSSSSEGDTLATVTARGASTSSNLSLAGNITTANGKYIGIGSTQANIEFGNGTIGNELTDLSLVTDSNGEITFYRGENRVIIGSSFGVYNSDFFVDTDTFYVDESADSVGIGTQTPSADLHIHGSDPVLKIRDSSTSDNTATLWLQESDTYGVKINYESNGGHGGLDYLTIDTFSASDSNNQAGNHANAWGLDQRGNVLPHKGAVDGNLLRPYEWNLYGTQSSGSTPSFPQNGATEENERIYGENPFGEPAILWHTPSNDSGDNADGGWNSDTFVIDRGKSYRTSVWVKKITTNRSDGNLYLGTSFVANISNSTYNSNPYFIGGTTMASAGMETGQWYLMVGYIYDSGHTGTTHHPDGGIYDRNGKKIYSANSFKFTDSGSPTDGLGSQWNTSRQRVYNYYDATTGSKTYWWGPRFEPLEASTPTLKEILNTPSSDTGAFFAGNVGIGTTGPSSTRTLHVQGDAEINTNLVANTAVYTKDWYGIGSNDQRILTSAGTAQVTIKNGGNVGIGTTSPAHQLHLNKEDAIAEMQISRGGSDPSTDTDIGRIQFKTDYSSSPNEVGSIWVRTNSSAYRTDMRFGVKATAGSEEVGLTIHGTNDGPLVGVGTTNPQTKLTVGSDGNEDGIELRESGNLKFKVRPSSSHAYLSLYDSTVNEDIRLNTNGDSWIGGGSLAVGMTDPSTSRVRIKGGTSDSSTNALQCIDSSSTQLFYVRNDGVVAVTDNYFYASASAGAYVQHNLRVRGSLFNDQGTLQIGNSSGTAFDGDVNFDSNTLYVDSSNDRVGIGVTNPNQKFVVTARSNFDSQNNYYGSWVDGNTAGDSFFAVGQWHNVGGRMQAGSNNMYIHTHNASHDLVLQSGGANVGIGTTSPNKQLQIGGAEPFIRLEESSSGGNKRLDLFVSNSTGVIGANQSAQTMMFQTVGTTRMTIEAGGNIAIGNTSAGAKLDIRTDSSTTNGVGLRLESSTGAYFTVSHGGQVNIGSTLYLDNNEIWAKNSNNLNVKADGLIRIQPQSYGTAATFATNGYVGIGTTEPAKKLSVYEAGNAQVQITGTNVSILTISDPNSHGQLNTYNDGTFRINSVANAAGTQLVLSGSNVGVGTASPSTPLHVKGNIRAEASASTAFADLKSSQIYASSTYDIIVGTNNSLFFRTNDTRRMAILGGGNVGIGTTNPAYKLDVIDSDGGTLARFKDSDSSHAGLIIQGDTNGGSITNASAFSSEVIYLQNSANAMRFYTDGTEAVRIDSSQRVGIGTNSVLGMLQVNGRALVEGPSVPTTLTVSDSGDATKAIRIGYEPTWDVGSISASDYGAGWKNIVIAPHAGKVGIGTTSPHQALSVKGTIVSYNTSYVQVAGMTNSSNAGRLYANNAGGVSKVLLDSNGDSYLDGGNVGIGTTGPATTLDVDGLISSDQIRSKKYTSLSGSANDWFPIGSINEHQTGPVLFQVITAYHSNMSFIVAKGYGPSQEHSITLLSSIDSNNTGYANIKGVRVRQDGQVEIQLYWASGPSVVVNVTARSTTDPVSLPSSLATSTSSENVVDTVTNEDGKLRSRKLITTSSNVQLSDNGISYLNGGNVGIGTTNPVQELQVNGNIYAAGGHFFVDNDKSLTAVGDLRLRTNNGTTAVFIDTSQNVGIGTNAPTSLLHVANAGGDATLEIEAGNTSSSILRFGDTDNNDVGQIEYDHADNSLRFYNNNTTERMRITSAGNVGIGTTSPSNALDVNGAIAVGSSYAGSSAPSDGMVIQGSVGIGTSSPSYDLHVEGEILAESNMLLGGDGTYGSTYGAIGIGTTSLTNGHHRIFAKSSDHMYFAAASSKGFRFRPNGGATSASAGVTIASDGDVGIGTTAPSSKLEVQGTIQTQVYGIGSLPSASPAGQRAMVNDSYYTFGSSTIGQTVYAGGSAVAPVYSDGSYWRYG